MPTACTSCNEDLPTDYALCSIRGCKLHFKCAGISETSWRKTNRSNWKCIECRSKQHAEVTGAQAEDTRHNKENEAISPQELRDFMLQIKEKLKSLDDLKGLKETVKGLEDSVQFMSNSQEEIIRELRESKKKTAELEKNMEVMSRTVKAQNSVIEQLQMKIRESDQYARNRNIEIDGIEEKEGENLKFIMKNIASKLEVSFQENDIDVVHRVPSRAADKPSKIIAQFSSRTIRDLWMEKKRILPILAKDIGIANSNKRIYLNTHLCSQWKDLLWKTKQHARPKGYHAVWYKNGKILVKKNMSDSEIIRILTEKDLRGAAPLKDVRVVIPQAVERHRDATLKCVYNMEGEKLYSIKWYKGQNEFFRYTPGERPPEKVFAVRGVNVMLERSDAKQVVLHKVDLSAEGRYACEVSADSPSFTTSMVEGRLTVVEVPHYPPNILGLQPRYRLGDWLKANCSTDPSHPPANLTIYVNGQQYVPREHIRDYKTKELDQGHRRSVVGVEIKLLPEHFGADNKLKIRCLATIYDVYNKVNERSVELRSANMMPPSVLETNQPPREPYDQDVYLSEPDRKRPRYPGDIDSGVGGPCGRPPLPAVLLVLLLLVASLR